MLFSLSRDFWRIRLCCNATFCRIRLRRQHGVERLRRRVDWTGLYETTTVFRDELLTLFAVVFVR